MNVIWDLAEADLSKLNADELIEIVNHIQYRTNMRGSGYKVALVTSNDLSFGIARMFEGYGYVLPLKIGVLKNMDDACKWVKGE